MTPRPRRRRRRTGGARLVLPRHYATAAHLCALHPFTVATGLGQHGVLLGHDRLAGGGFFFDLHTAYHHGYIQGPNMVVSGAGAHGKSAVVKTYLHRLVAHTAGTGGQTRWTAVIDPKGEWTALGRKLDWAVLALRPGGTLRVNPLDTGPTAPRTREDADDRTARRASVVAALLAVALDQPALTPGDQRLVTAVARQLTHRATDPTLVDVRNLLAHPDQTLADQLDTTHDELTDRRRPLLDACATLLDHDLRGICDGPTSPDVHWHDAPGLVLDLSALLTNRRAVKLALTATAGWLQTVLYTRPDQHKLTVLDEAWTALDDLAVVRFLQDQWRLGRQWGAANILITHALSDLTSQTGTGTATARIAEGLLHTTSVRVYLHQNPEQVTRLLTDMGLNPTQADLLHTLPPFTALWQVGQHTTLVDHHIAPDEWEIADTDTAMRGHTVHDRPHSPTKRADGR